MCPFSQTRLTGDLGALPFATQLAPGAFFLPPTLLSHPVQLYTCRRWYRNPLNRMDLIRIAVCSKPRRISCGAGNSRARRAVALPEQMRRKNRNPTEDFPRTLPGRRKRASLGGIARASVKMKETAGGSLEPPLRRTVTEQRAFIRPGTRPQDDDPRRSAEAFGTQSARIVKGGEGQPLHNVHRRLRRDECGLHRREIASGPETRTADEYVLHEGNEAGGSELLMTRQLG